MRSAPTARLDQTAEVRRSLLDWWRLSAGSVARRLARGATAVGVLAVLAGCATGTAEEARLGQARDAATDPNVPRQQATRTAERFFPTPGKPTPTPAPNPTVGELVVTTSVDGGDAPQGSYAAIPADATVYAAALLRELHDGQVVSARWVDAAGNDVNTARVEIDAKADQRWVALPLGSASSVAPGEYAVYLYVGERRLGSVLFQITGAGTGGVTLPARPENPAADRGGPGEVPNPGGGNQQQTNRNGAQQGGDPNAPNTGNGNVVPNGQDPNAPQAAPVATDPDAVPASGEVVAAPTPGGP